MKNVPVVSRGGRIVAYAIVDDEDHGALSVHRWYLNSDGYVWTNLKLRTNVWQGRSMHRVLLDLVPGDSRQGDHINRDKLDNRRSNLRVVTAAQNSQNTPGCGGSSQHRGVTWHKACGKWQATAKVLGKSHYLGLFDDELRAAQAAQEFRRQHMPFSYEEAA